MKPITVREVNDWVSGKVHQYANAVLFKEQTPAFWAEVRTKITHEYYSSKPEGLVMIQSIITQEIDLYKGPLAQGISA